VPPCPLPLRPCFYDYKNTEEPVVVPKIRFNLLAEIFRLCELKTFWFACYFLRRRPSTLSYEQESSKHCNRICNGGIVTCTWGYVTSFYYCCAQQTTIAAVPANKSYNVFIVTLPTKVRGSKQKDQEFWLLSIQKRLLTSLGLITTPRWPNYPSKKLWLWLNMILLFMLIRKNDFIPGSETENRLLS